MTLRLTLIAAGITTVFLLPFSADAKRAYPKPVLPVIYDGIEYRIPSGRGNMGFVEAIDKTTNQQLWNTRVYRVWIIPGFEEDCQWVFINDMRVQNGRLRITNEEGKVFRLDLKSGQVEGDRTSRFLLFFAGVFFLFVAFFIIKQFKRPV